MRRWCLSSSSRCIGFQPGFIAMAWKSIKDTSSSTTALWTALKGSVPQVKGPWLWTSTADGIYKSKQEAQGSHMPLKYQTIAVDLLHGEVGGSKKAPWILMDKESG